MRSSRKKTKKSTIAALIVAIAVVQVAIFIVVKQSREKKSTAAAEEVALVSPQASESMAAKPVEEAPGEATSQTPPAAAAESPAADTAPVAAIPVATEEVPEKSAVPPTPQPAAKASVARAKPTSTGGRRSKRESRRSRVSEPQPATPTPPAIVAKEQPTTGSVSIVTSPSGATVALDGVFVGKSPMRDVDVAPGRHSVALSLSGFDPKVVSVRVVAGRSEKISETLRKTAVAVVAPPPSTSSPTRVVAQRSPATPRVASSKEGDAGRGKGILSSRCNSCHAKSGASSVGPRHFTSSQWDRFFARGSHDRYQRLGGEISSGQLAHVKTYLKSKAADAARNQGAGIR